MYSVCSHKYEICILNRKEVSYLLSQTFCIQYALINMKYISWT